ncbi:DUF2254 domain-containing protein [Archangium gephyra]|uniref:DUF2254 domain-containing protein n=1 Tax=Archangium gephyra TaxID=48 RepID=UPI003B7F1BFC
MRYMGVLRKVHPSFLREYFRTSLWLAPAASVLAAISLVAALLRVDQSIGQHRQAWYLFNGQPDSAREFLSTIASSLMAFTGVVFSITILVLQLASSQFSPRVLRTFLEDKLTQFSMGMFVGSFAYAMMLLPEVRDGTDQNPGFVPAFSIFVAFALVILCLGVFVRYIHHMAHSIRAVNVVRRVADETRRSIQRMYPEQAEEPAEPIPLPPEPPDLVIPHDRPPGVVVAVEEEELMTLARHRDVIIGLVPLVGDFLPRGAPLFKVWGKGRLSPEEPRDYVVVGAERTPHQDPAFGFRQLVDVADRALSAAINDPTTAVQALDQIHDLLRSLATRAIPAPTRVDASGQLRLILPRPDWETFVRLGLDEIREYSEGDIQVARRLRAVLVDLLSVAPAERRTVIQEQLDLLEAAIRRGFHTQAEQQSARIPSTQGQP